MKCRAGKHTCRTATPGWGRHPLVVSWTHIGRNGAFLPRDAVCGVRHSANDVDVGESLRKACMENNTLRQSRYTASPVLCPTYMKSRADPGRCGVPQGEARHAVPLPNVPWQ